MANSMLDAITQLVTPSLTSEIGAMEGESQSAVTKGFAAAIPAVLGLVTSRANDPGFVSQLFALANDPNCSTLLDDPDRLMDQVTSPVRNGGPVDRFSSMILGANRDRLVDTITRFAGVSTTAASSILGASIPLVLGYISKIVWQDGLDSAALGRQLAAEYQSVLNAVPAGFSSILSRGAARASAAAQSVDEDMVAPTISRTSSAWAWVAAAVALAVAWGAFSVMNRHRATQTAMVQSSEQAVGTAGDYATVLLPNGTTLQVPPAGSEAKLLAAVTSRTPMSPDTWFEFDRVGFEPDSATLTPDSRTELSGIASILNAYPNVHLKIGGYTDNSGDPTDNLTLSRARATSVRDTLVSMGVPADRLEAEGYGETNPIASNDTEEGRAENRRVAFSVTAE